MNINIGFEEMKLKGEAEQGWGPKGHGEAQKLKVEGSSQLRAGQGLGWLGLVAVVPRQRQSMEKTVSLPHQQQPCLGIRV